MGKKYEKTLHQRRSMKSNKPIKNAHHYYSSGKCKLNLQRNITAYSFEWIKLKTLTIPSAGEDINIGICICQNSSNAYNKILDAHFPGVWNMFSLSTLITR